MSIVNQTHSNSSTNSKGSNNNNNKNKSSTKNNQLDKSVVMVRQSTVVNTDSGIIYGLPENINTNLLGVDIDFDYINNFPILEIIPGKMEYNGSKTIVNAWDFIPEKDRFYKIINRILSDAGISTNKISGIPFRFATNGFSANESINSNYSESSLQGANDLVSTMVKDYAYMSNKNFDTFKSIVKGNLEGISPELQQTLSGIYNSINSSLGLEDKIRSISNNTTVGGLLSGSRVDLPKIWKNSQNDKIYTIKITLSSSVDNIQALIDRVLIPYVILLTLSSPISNEKYLYQWPFVVSAKIKGIFNIPLGAITTMQIMKPGEHLHLSNKNKMLSITVTLSISSLYSTQFIVEGDGELPQAMLTVNDEVKTIAEGFIQ